MELPIWNSRVPASQAAESSSSSSSNSSPPARSTTRVSGDNCDDIFCFLAEFGVLVCKEHCSGVVNLNRHLLEHHKTPVNERKEIVQRFAHYERKHPKDFELPEQPADPIEELGTPLDGFGCKTCEFLTININAMRIHLKKNHKQAWEGEKSALFDSVKVQTFFSSGGLQKYFLVNLGVGVNSENGKKLDQKQRVAQQLSDYKKIRGQVDNDRQVMEETTKIDKTGWFKRTGWLTLLEGRNLAHLGHQTRLPDRNEARLQQAAKLTEGLIERSVRGLATLPREIRRWLRSAQPTVIDQRPLARLQNPESQATYASYMIRFVCFYLRIIADEERQVDEYLAQRDRAVDVGVDVDVDSASDGDTDIESEYDDSGYEDSDREGTVGSKNDAVVQGQPRSAAPADKMKDARELFRWKDDQHSLAVQLWLSLGDDDAAAQTDKLINSLASFIFTGYGTDEFSSGLVQYLAMLGIDTRTNRLRTAKNFSYMLAGIVYCVRVVAVEKLLPAAEHEDLTEEQLEHFLEVRKKYLADGSLSPMSAMISLLAYGKHVALSEGNAGNAQWSNDKKTFYLSARPIVIERFRKMAQSMEAELEDKFWQLCWVDHAAERFSIDLAKIQDDITFTTRGKSFVTTAGNNLSDGLEWMLTRACSTEDGMRLQTSDGRWKRKKVHEYLRQMDRFLELMLGCVHIESGQPARGSEIVTMRHCNGLLQDRNIFVMDGTVMTVVRYHKSQSQWDKPKVVPRFLPPRLGQIMALYLSYLQPFREFLVLSVLKGGLSDYVWSNEQGAWDTDRLTRVLKRETGKRLGVELHTLDYRHTAVGIGRVMVGESFGKGYQDEIGEIDEAEVDEDEEDLVELQNARSTVMGVSHYSVSIDIVKHLSTRSIDAFRALSTAWHRFLGVDGRTEAPEERIVRRKRRMRESISGLPLLPKEKAVQVEDPRAAAIQRALQQVLGKQDVGFRSMEQEQALYAVLDKQSPLVVVLPTGGGKSLLFTLPAYIEENKVTVVVVPYRALIEDLLVRVRSYGVECMEWQHGENNPASVVFVSADVVGDVKSNGNFLGYARLLRNKGLLQRVVVDECHLVFTSRHWREDLLKVKNLRLLGCPVVLLTATLPPVKEEELETSMLVRNATYIRAGTTRPNARYFVSWCQRRKLEDTALVVCKRWAEKLGRSRQKGVVYCLSKAQCERMAKEIGCPYYHAELEERGEKLQGWVEQGGLIVATSALGTGVDYAGIVYILHVGMPWSMSDFAQASGRGGRGGETYEVVVMVGHGEVERTMEQKSDDIDVQAMGVFLIGEGCRREIKSSYLDGQGVGCREIDAVCCDRCGEGEEVWLEEHERWAEEWAVVEEMFTELRGRCAICWVVGQQFATKEEEQWKKHWAVQWKKHWAVQCKAWERASGAEADRFRRKIVDRTVKNNCRRCWVSQKYCATGEGVENRCQWPNVVIPLVYAARLTRVGIQTIGESGFGEIGDEAYAGWLGKRSQEEMWGQVFSNAMVVAIRLVLRIVKK